MDVILPDNVVSPADLPASTWGEATRLLTAAQAEGRATRVRLRLPRLDLSSQPTDLIGVVESLGVPLRYGFRDKRQCYYRRIFSYDTTENCRFACLLFENGSYYYRCF